ncbi:YaiO family outer membrane beta-barrel protein [Litchfieldella xinjiangensis]|uniref:YaiO family outer membrane beta-barrel protein n=1 Tax=Litchfieldella xinjiangensis TaxID=1166948 RepID=UPI0018CD5B14|nr:YaiO family outer membrane beta-barrel protein [Halomonas xinjiangensis]
MLMLGSVAGPAFASPALDRAREYIEADNLPVAETLLARHLETSPEDRPGRLLYGQVLAWQGNYSAALAQFDRLLAEQPEDVDALLARGQALLWSGQPERALAPLEKAETLAPDYALVSTVVTQAREALNPTQPMPAAPSQTPGRRVHELEASWRHERLDGGYADWQTQRIDYASSRAGAPTWYAAALREQRYDAWDTGIEAGAVFPLDERWSLQPEIGIASSPTFLPEHYLDLAIQRVLPRGVVSNASLRRTQYEASHVDRLALGLERYWGVWRAAYTLNVSDVEGAGRPVGHDLGLDYYYSGPSSVGLRASLGREEEAVPGGDVVTTDVHSLSLRGRHWLTPQWAMSWELGHLSQGRLYDRRGIQLGIRHAF